MVTIESKKTANSGYWRYAGSFSYAPSGAATSMQLGNGRWESTRFNSRLQPTKIAVDSTQLSDNILKLEYSYGTTHNSGNILSQQITIPTVGGNPEFVASQNYQYDSLNRLTEASETVPNQTGWQQTFVYDRYGNRRFDTAQNRTTTLPVNCATAVCNPEINQSNNRLIGTSFDSAGNTTVDANSQQYLYDGENKLVEARDAAGNLLGKYWYDGDGKRVKKYVPATGEVTVFVYDASGKTVEEYSTKLSDAPQVAYLTSDHLGSPRLNTGPSGAVVSRHDYRPFGEEIFSTSRNTGNGYDSDEVRKKFTKYERDEETDLDFAEARYYNSTLGRFGQTDPELGSAKASIPQSFNRYSYVLNNPLIYIDPSGELWIRNANDGRAGDQPYMWVDKCPRGGTCYEAVAANMGTGVRVYGSRNADDVTNYQANENGVVDVRALSGHHNAEFIVADGQNVPEEFLKTGSATALFNVAKYYSEVYPNDDELVFTAGAARTGRPGICKGSPCHGGHAGVDIDLRYMGSDGRPIQSESAYATADIGRTNFLVKVFQDNSHPYSYTGDDSRFGRPDDSPNYIDGAEYVHRHHLHVGLTKPSNKPKPKKKK